VLLDHREEIAEQGTLLGGQLARDRIGSQRARATDGLADAGVTASIRGRRGGAVVTVDLGLARYVCFLFRRNSMASWCLVRQAA
jgi:hypothetical protein